MNHIPQVAGEHALHHTHQTNVVDVRGPDGRIQTWVLGFTYKAWRCAVTGQTIPANGYGDTASEGWAWRVAEPKSARWAKIRVSRDAFKQGTFTITQS